MVQSVISWCCVVLLVHTAIICEGLRLYESCRSHSDCPVNSKCRPSGCDGYTCRCDNSYVSSDDRQTCVKATRIGEPCTFGQSRCISPFSMCLGTCQCFSVFKPTQDGRCKLPDVSFVDEDCGKSKCEFPAVCENGICVCKSPYRKLTEEEFWLDPLNPVQCKPESYSLDVCNVTKLTVPLDVSLNQPSIQPTTQESTTFVPTKKNVTTTFKPSSTTTTSTTTTPTTTTTKPTTTTPLPTTTTVLQTTSVKETTTKLLPKTTASSTTEKQTTATTMMTTATKQTTETTTKQMVTETSTTASTTLKDKTTRRLLPTTTTTTTASTSTRKTKKFTTTLPPIVPVVIKAKQNVFDTCQHDDECPYNSRCRPNGCKGYTCLCNEGYIAREDNQACLIATKIGEVCNPLISKCVSPFAICAGLCQCLDDFVPTPDGRCRLPDVSFLGGECGHIQCAYPASCVRGICKCAGPYRNVTSSEFWADPTVSDQCKLKTFSLHKCNDKYIPVPPGISIPLPPTGQPELATNINNNGNHGNRSVDTYSPLWKTLDLQTVLIPTVVASALFINIVGIGIVCLCRRKQQLRKRQSSTKTYMTDIDDERFKIPRPNISHCPSEKDWRSYTNDDWKAFKGCQRCNPYATSIQTNLDDTDAAYDEIERQDQCTCQSCS